MCYFRIEESLYGEQLIGLLFHKTQIGHDVVLTNPCRGAQHVFYYGAIPLYFREDAVYTCGTTESKTQDYPDCLYFLVRDEHSAKLLYPNKEYNT